MSFSSDVKKELCKSTFENREQLVAEFYGMVLFAKCFSSREIVLKTENPYTASRFELLLSELFNPIIEKQSFLKLKNSNTKLYKVSVVSSDDCERIFEELGHYAKDIKLKINRANIESEQLYPYFLRGVFLSCGSVTDPQKAYHLELSVQFKTLAENLILFLNEIDVLNVNSKIACRKGTYIVYIKGNDPICDFLGYIGASTSVMVIIETSAYKEIRNKINRQRNSEIANLQKLASAAAVQNTAIKKIIDIKGIDFLSDELKELALLRLENPDMSLKELGENLTVPISRSGVNHRLHRIINIAESIQEV